MSASFPPAMVPKTRLQGDSKVATGVYGVAGATRGVYWDQARKTYVMSLSGGEIKIEQKL